ncbi:MAG: 5-aminolevulinate synthase [Saprospiraceae bacterium]
MNKNNKLDLPFDFEEFLSSKLKTLKESGAYRKFINIQKDSATFPKFKFITDEGNEKNAINWCSNDYLGMSNRSTTIQAAMDSNQKHGTGSGGTRNISGSTIHHTRLERKLAKWHKKESALVFNSAYQANLTTLTTLGRHIPDLIFISDEENHASIIEGIRGHPNTKYIFRHNDMEHLQSILQNIPLHTPKIVVFESIYSISGTLAPVSKILELSKAFHALSYADEVHAVGMYGENGSGIINQENLCHQVDFINGTLSKAIGVFGGYVAASEKWIDFIRSFASGFIFTTSLPPAVCNAALSSINEIESSPALRISFFKNVNFLREQLVQSGIQFNGAETHITQIPIGSAIACKQIADHLLYRAGIYVQPINFPTVIMGNECLRITITPLHTFDQIYNLVYHLQGVLHHEVTLTGRGSMLSKVQLSKAQEKIKFHFPWISTKIICTLSRGDQLVDIPLHTQEGTDFFTKELELDLHTQKADIAIHSLKDMSTEHFLGEHLFAVIDRELVYDIVLFKNDILERIKQGKTLKIGTCSFRRELLGLEFLKTALPYLGIEIKLEAVPIRGNIDTRIEKLDTDQYDGIILAFAGINRMFASPDYQEYFKRLVENKKIMVLPKFECVPAPCQGAIVAEALPSNFKAQYIVQNINEEILFDECKNEKMVAGQYGSGCIQKFGVATFHFENFKAVYSKGIDQYGQPIDTWNNLPPYALDIDPELIINSSNLGFTSINTAIEPMHHLQKYKTVFVSHIAAVHASLINDLSTKNVWCAGSSTWQKLAAKGIWVSGCADSLGFEHLSGLFKTPFININPKDIVLLSNADSSKRWIDSGAASMATYQNKYHSNLLEKYKLKTAQLVFWTCYAHYDEVKELIAKDLLHACLPGKTFQLLRDRGHQPIIFPTIKAFNQWKKKYTQAHRVA